MNNKKLLNDTLKKNVNLIDREVQEREANKAINALEQSVRTKSGAFAGEINGGVQTLTSKYDRFQDTLNSTTTEGLLSSSSKSIENISTNFVNEQVTNITGAFGSKVEVTFSTIDGITVPQQSSLDATGGVSGTIAGVLQLITGLGVGAGNLQKAVIDASPEGLLKAGKDLTGKIGGFTASTINSLATDAVSSVTDELETLVGSITDINRTVTMPGSIDQDSASPTFGDITDSDYPAHRMPTGNSEFQAMLNNVKTDPLNSLNSVVTKENEIKQNLKEGKSDFVALSGNTNGTEVINSAIEQQNLRNAYQSLADERNSIIQSRSSGDGTNGIVQELSTETLTDLKKQVKDFAPKITDADAIRVINLSQGNSQDFSTAVDLLFQSTGRPASVIRTFLKTIDTTITKATLPTLDDAVFDEPYVIGSFEKEWNEGQDNPVFPYISSLEELQAELRNIKRDVTEVVVHWTETPTNKNIGSEEINETHLAADLKGIGYHYVIRRDGSLQRGRPANIEGEHAITNNHNTRSIGIVFVGGINVPSETRNIQDFLSVQSLTRSQFNTFDHFCRAFYDVFAGGQIVGHSDIDDLANDPGFDVRAYVKANFDKDSKFTTPLKQGPLTVDEINS